MSATASKPYKAGKAFLLKLRTDGGAYRTIAGLRETASTTEPDKFALTGAGIFLGSAAEAEIRAIAISGRETECELNFETGEQLRGKFTVKRLDYQGDFNGERNYSIQLEGALHE